MMENESHHFSEHFSGALGYRGTETISGEQGNIGYTIRGTGEQKQFRETGNTGNKDFNIGEQGNKAIHFRGTREQI